MPTINEILEENLDTNQCQAAMDSSKEILTLACAGSGKSRTLAFRIARLLVEGIDPSSIVAFTFTEKAAESIKLRVSEALAATEISPTILGAMYIGTIHSYCQNVLGEMDAKYRQFDVLDDNRLKLYLISRYARLGLQQIRSARNARYFEVIKEVSNAWSIANDEMIDFQTIVSSDPELGNSLINFRQLLQQEQFIDFSMMIRLVAEGLANNDPSALRAVSNLKHLMVDEYQDVNPAQELLIRELHRLSDTLFVVGDDDQSIYGWRGADVRNILTFTQRYPGSSVHTLATNYRSTQAIVDVSDRFIAAELGPNRFPKNPLASSNETPRDFRKLWFNAREDEAEWVLGRIQQLFGIEYREKNGTTRGLTYSDFAILMRSTRSGEPARHTDFTQRLTNAGVPYSLESGGSVFDRPQVSILRESYELLRQDSPNRQQAEQFYNARVLPNFPDADFNRFANVLSSWGRQIHAPISGARRKVYPQQLVHDLLNAFGIEQTNFDSGVMQDIGLFSRMMQDVETVYLSIDTAARYQDILNFLANIAESGYDTSTDDVLRRPDVVTVSTVHKLKGLEFPVVFIVDAEASRFPGTNRSYQGWLPANVIQTALNRNAYRGNPEEEARLFYTALTRAERFLSVSGSERLPNGVKRWRVSPFSLRLNHPEISTDLADTNNYQRATPKQRVDETVLPTTYTDIKYYLRCPKDYQFRKSFGFSPPVPELFGFGKTVHTSIEKLHELFTTVPPTPEQVEEVVNDTFHLKHVFQSRDPENNPGPYERARTVASDIAKNYVNDYSTDFTQQKQLEVSFEIPVSKAVITGAIDLVIKQDESGNIINASVIDFKSMEGGESPEENEELHWTELALQVQLYAKAAQDVLGLNAQTGSVHLLKDNQRVSIPISEDAIDAAIANVEWAVERIIDGDFPMRPEQEKCASCDFRFLCPKVSESFTSTTTPPLLHLPGNDRKEMARAFSEFE